MANKKRFSLFINPSFVWKKPQPNLLPKVKKDPPFPSQKEGEGGSINIDILLRLSFHI